MYNILIVDDEPGHLAGLSKILHRLRPNYAVRTAKNGQEALHICDANRFEIIFTDIQMPIMDGFDFFERLPSSRKPQKVIFLSGYDYFEYAQKAIGLGSFEYLLKPVDIDKFTLILEKAERSLMDEQASLYERESMSAKLNTIIPLYQNRILSEWIHGNSLSQKDRVELSPLINFPVGGTILVTSIHKVDNNEEAVKAANFTLVKETMKALLSDYGKEVSFYSEQERNQLVSITEAKLDDVFYDRLLAVVRSTPFDNISLSIGVSQTTEKMLQDAPVLFKEASIAAMERFYLDDRLVYDSSSSRIDDRLFLKPSTRHDALFSDAVHATDGKKAILDASKALLTKLTSEQKLPTPQELINYCKKRLVKLTESTEYLKSEVQERLVTTITESLERVHCLKELEQAVADRLHDISEAIAETRRDSKETVIFKCLAYMEEHYMEDLSLESVSAVFHFNSSYFCHYFKSKLNINFSQYLTQIRLTKAKQLLEQENDKIYQLASKLGYQDVKYFNRVFKKEFGLTPEEYRTIARSMKKMN